jgi:HSP20 family protein
MTISKWVPWYHLPQQHAAVPRGRPYALRGDLDRLFQQLLTNIGTDPPGPGHEAFDHGLPRITVDETDEEIRIEAELPGLTEDDFELTLEDDHLILAASVQRETEQDGEGEAPKGIARYAASFRRVVPLTWDIEREQVEALLDKGVLTVRLPKAAPHEESTKRIAVRSA